MSTNIKRNQLERLKTISGLLHKRYFLDYDGFYSVMSDLPELHTSPRTFIRDIATLRKLGADIKYSQENKGYYLKNKDWNLYIPSRLIDTKTLLLSELIARNFLPSQIQKDLRESVDSLFANCLSGLPENMNVCDFQVITPEFFPQVDSEIFRKAYQAWESSSFLKIEYCSLKGHNSVKLILPKVFAWDNGCWYIKGLIANEDGISCNPPWDIRVFALHRIKEAEVNRKYIPDEEEMSRFCNKDLFDFQKYDEVEIEFFLPEAERIKERFMSNPDVFIHQDEKSFTVRLKDISEYTVMPLIFRAMGRARVIKPDNLRESLRKVAMNIFDNIQ